MLNIKKSIFTKNRIKKILNLSKSFSKWLVTVFFIAIFVNLTSAFIYDSIEKFKNEISLSNQGLISFIRNGDIFIIKPDGSKLQRLTYSKNNSAPIWSPNAKYLAYLHRKTDRATELQVISLLSRNKNVLLTLNNVAEYADIKWSPSGNQLFIDNVPSPYIVNLKDKKTIKLPKTILDIAWSQGFDIAYIDNQKTIKTLGIYDKEPLNFNNGYKIYKNVEESRLNNLNWSPQNIYLSFEKGYSNTNDIYIENILTKKTENITNSGGARDHVWSPNGMYILFKWSYSSTGFVISNRTSGLYFMNISNKAYYQLIDEEHYKAEASQQSWSPNNKMVVFFKYTTLDLLESKYKSKGIFWIDIETKEERQLTKGNDTHPSWSPITNVKY